MFDSVTETKINILVDDENFNKKKIKEALLFNVLLVQRDLFETEYLALIVLGSTTN